MNPKNPFMKWAIRSLLIFAVVAGSLSIFTNHASAYWGWPSDPQPELSGSVSVSPGSVTAGQTVTVNYTIYCNSPGICITGWWSGGWLPWTNNVYVSTSEGGTGTLLKSFGANLIQANSSVSGSFTAIIPSTLKSGTYWITFYVDSYGIFNGIRQDGNSWQEVPETNENNNISSAPIQVTGIKSDLSPTSISLSGANIEAGKIVAGKDLTVNFTIQNNGDVASGAFSNSIYLATTQYGIQTLLGTFPMASIPAGASASDSRTVTIPSGTPNEFYPIIVFADSGETVNELAENNNAGDGAIIYVGSYYQNIPSLPDLTTSSVSLSASGVNPGENVAVSFTINNNGSAKAGPFSIRVSLATSQYGIQTLLGALSYGGMWGMSGQAFSVQYGYPVLFTIPSGTAAGSYWVTVYADSGEVVTEDNENNNIGSAAIQINGPPAIKTTTLISPNGNEIWAGGSTKTVIWTASDITDTDLETNPITLEYTVDGTTWIKDVSPLPNTGSFNWVVPFVNSTTVKVRITAKDKMGNTSSDVSQNGDSYFVTDNISFNGAQSFDSDGDTMTFEWSSSIDGILGTTATLSKKLTAGGHTISLKVSDGKEGQSTTSVSITVKQQKALYVSWGNHNTPASIKPGQIVSVNITLTNTGTQTWSHTGANAVYVTYHWYNSSWQAVEWGIGMWSALSNDVASGQSVSITAALKAPSTPGTYNLLWDVVQQGVTWFSGAGAPLLPVSGIAVQ